MKNIFKTIAFLAIVGLVFTGCQKGEDSLMSQQDVVTQGSVSEPAVIDGQKMIYDKLKKIEKGLYVDEENPYFGFVEEQTIKDYPFMLLQIVIV